MTDYSRVPVEYMAEGVMRYIEHGVRPGSFLMALFSNDLKETVARADDNNRAALLRWVYFMYNEMPSESQGSPQQVAEWIKQRGLASREAPE